FGVNIVVTVHADEEERRAVSIRAPHDCVDVEGATVRGPDPELCRAADLQGGFHQADLGPHGAQVHGLELEMAVSDLEDYRPCDFGPRVPPQISPALRHAQPPLLVGDSLTGATVWQAPSARHRLAPSQGDSAQKRKKIGRVFPCSLRSLRQRVRTGWDSRGGGYEFEEAQPAITSPETTTTSGMSALMRTPQG